MRFDIVLNDLCGLAWTTKRIALTSDGSPWRPIVHIEDICHAIQCALGATPEVVNGEIFNVGADSENYRVREIAQIVADVFPGCELTVGPKSADNRSYRESFAKISSRLPGFSCKWTARLGAEELRDVFSRIDADKPLWQIRRPVQIFLGDYVDRGPASREVLDMLIARSRADEVVLLKGNHEAMLLEFFDNPSLLGHWRQFGGLQTLISYGLKPSINPTIE